MDHKHEADDEKRHEEVILADHDAPFSSSPLPYRYPLGFTKDVI
jgi:hypothetical protein